MAKSGHIHAYLNGVTEDHRQSLGKLGENLACAALSRACTQSLPLPTAPTNLARIDIVARDGDTTVFVEVKARAGDEFAVQQRQSRMEQRKLH